MIPLIVEENKSYVKQKVNTNDENKIALTKMYQKVKDLCHYIRKFRGAAHNICNLRCKTAKKFPAVFHNGSTCDYHFIIKEPEKEFDGQL